MSFVRRSTSFLKVQDYDSKKLKPERNVEDHDFFYDRDDFALLAQDWTDDRLTHARLGEMGGIQGIALATRTDLKNGLFADECEGGNFEVRHEKYGRNAFIKQPPRSFLWFCAQELKDKMLIVLMVAGVISIIGGTINHPEDGWIEGFAILIAVAAVSMISGFNNYNKEMQFRRMDDKKDEKQCIVIRNGKEIAIDTKEVCVGDLVLLQTGVTVPCDGIWVTGTEQLKCEESAMTGEPRGIRKDFDRSFLLAGTQVVDGEGVMIAIAVGTSTAWGRLLSRLSEERPETPLQKKLDKMASVIGYGGAAVAILLFVVLMIRWAVEIAGDDTRTYSDSWSDIISFFIVAVTIIVVAVPEGLPLAVTISLAYSMKKMLKDNNFVRVLAACETMGNATTICSDKTGTLTQNLMSVHKLYLASNFYDYDELPTKQDINKAVLKIVADGIALNSKVFEKLPEGGEPQVNGRPILVGGNETECALLRWIINLDSDYKSIRKENPIEKAYPFSSAVKRSSVLVKAPGAHRKFRMYLKGAAERVFALCTHELSKNGEVEELSPERRTIVEGITSKMTKTGLRCICMAYRDYDYIEYDAHDIPIDPKFNDFICVGITGIQDPLRPEVRDAVLRCQDAGIIVRMVTGDHIDTARFIARDCHIITNHDQIVMTGSDFRVLTAQEQEDILPKLRVLARSTPEDKEKLVVWFRDHGEVVAVTGDGANDALALKEADVGLSMGIQGTDVAKEASDIIIMDDNFASIVKTVMWGRSVYDNIRKFLQFQLTVNVVALVISLIGAFAGFENPLNAVQLLWVNLIMDTLAALALGTEYPTFELLNRRPYRRDCSLVSKTMWKNIIGQSVLQLAILGTIMFVPTIVGLSSEASADNDISGPFDKTDEGHILRTAIFNTFVWLQIFNEFNARKINNERNKVKRIFDNMWFTYILVAIIILQVLMVEFFDAFAKTTGLNVTQWFICIGFGALSIPTGFLLTFIPSDLEDGMVEKRPDAFRKDNTFQVTSNQESDRLIEIVERKTDDHE